MNFFETFLFSLLKTFRGFNDINFLMPFKIKALWGLPLIKCVRRIIAELRQKERKTVGSLPPLHVSKNGLSLIFLVIRNVTGIKRCLKILFIDNFPPIRQQQENT